MHKPKITYLVSSPYGDITVNEGNINFHLDGDPSETTYKTYFNTIEKFVFKKYPLILSIIRDKIKKIINPEDIKEIIIRAEKHGAISHPSSIEFIHKYRKTKFCLNVSTIDTHKIYLKREYMNLKKLNEKYSFSYIPEVYFFGYIDNFSFILEEWLDGYHEFHFTYNDQNELYLNLWEFGSGYRALSKKQAFSIFKEISKILTLYFDTSDFSQINSWHNSAGDFIAKIYKNNVKVKLTTVREYKPLIYFKNSEHKNLIIALIYFFLNMSLMIRIDKIDGVKDNIWLDDFCIKASFKGFLDALKIKKKDTLFHDLDNRIIKTLQSFNKEELKIAYKPVLELKKNTSEYEIILKNLDKHIEEFYLNLQNYPS